MQKRRPHKRKYYNRILAAYIVVVILYTILFATYFYIQNAANIYSDVNAKNQLNLMQLARNADTRFSLANEMLARLCQEEALIEYATGESVNPGLIPDIGEALRKNVGDATSKGLNTYITRFTGESDQVIGKDAVVSVYDLMVSLDFADQTGADIRYFFSQEENADRCFARYVDKGSQNANRLVIVQRYAVGGEHPVFFVNDYNVETLFGMSEQPENALMVMDDKDIICNLSPDPAVTDQAMADMLHEYKAVSAIKGQGIQKAGFIFEVTRSNIYNWNYVIGVSNSEYITMARNLSASTFFIYGALLLLSILLVMILTHRLYRPIKQVVDFIRPYNEEQPGDEMEYIARTVSKIGTVNQDLMDIVQSNKVPLKSKYFKDLLFGLLSEDKLHEVVEQFSLQDIAPPLRVVLLEFSNYEMLQDAFSKEAIFAIKEQINVFISEQLSACMIHDVLELDYKRFALIARESDLQTLRKSLMNVVMMVEGSFDVEITGAIGDSSPSLSDLYESYNSAAAILENRFTIGSRNAVVTTEDISLAMTSSFYYPLDVERDLITHVIRLKREECHKILGNILNENIDKRSLGKDRRSAFIFAITATLNRIVESMNKNTDEVFGEGNIVFLELKMCTDGQELKNKVHQLFDKIIDYLDVENRQAEDNLSGKLLDYIHQNYNQDISLLDIGGHFNLSQCYISTLFKDITGENFKEYLSRYRIKKAKEMLERDPAIKNKDLAQMIGCNTVATLFRLFNKYEGVSPGQFVKNLNNEHQG